MIPFSTNPKIGCDNDSLISDLYNMDCIEGMRQYPDKHFDLAVVDPPYGIERFKKASGTTRFKSSELMQKHGLIWDNKPTNGYWDELFRISKNQIVWGANNFVMPPSEYFLIWNKMQTLDNFASAEYAWVSMGLKTPSKVFDYSIHKHNLIDKIHPTQKPVALYDWIFKNYAQEGQLILDTHLVSGSSRISAYNAKLNFISFEIDTDYCTDSTKRFLRSIAQLKLF